MFILFIEWLLFWYLLFMVGLVIVICVDRAVVSCEVVSFLALFGKGRCVFFVSLIGVIIFGIVFVLILGVGLLFFGGLVLFYIIFEVVDIYVNGVWVSSASYDAIFIFSH